MKKIILFLAVMALVSGCVCKQTAVAEPEGRYDFLTKKFNMWNIVPPSVGNEDIAIKDIIEFYKRTGIDTVLYSMPLNPRRADQYQYLEEMIRSYRKIKAGLAGYPIKTGVLIQAILGHVTNPTVVVEDWTRTYTSQQKANRFCALHPGFAKYIRTVGAKVAAEKPFFILGDDDIRSNNGGRECFCKLHVAEYNRRFNGKFKTPEEYRSAVVNAKNTDQVYLNYEILRSPAVPAAPAVNTITILMSPVNSLPKVSLT